jgi:hypothetical protein
MSTSLPWGGTSILLDATLQSASRRPASRLATQRLLELRNSLDLLGAVEWLVDPSRDARVRGFGFGVQWRDGLPTSTPCFLIFAEPTRDGATDGFPAPASFREVVLQIDPSRGNNNDPIPDAAVRVHPASHARAMTEVVSHASMQRRVRPALGGCSLGHPSVSSGTLGLVVRRGDERFILSNAHVLAGLNAGREGDPVLQPSHVDLGTDRDVIGHLARYEPLVLGDASAGPGGDTFNRMDAALASVTSPDAVAEGVVGLGPIPAWRALADVPIGTPVAKVGRTSGLTTGFVLAVGVTYKIDYGLERPLVFTNQIMTTPMADGGDSGALLVGLGAQRSAVGLILGGSDRMTLATPIEVILKCFGVVAAPARWRAGP